MIQEIGSYAGLAAFFGLALIALLSFTHGRDIRRLREWAGSAPERDAERKEATSTMAARRAEELRQLEEARTAEQQALDEREVRRRRRAEGGAEGGLGERISSRLAEPRYLVAIFVLFLAVVAGGAYVILSDSGEEASSGKPAAKAAAPSKPKQPEPSEVEVTVLNGTSSPGLAATFGDEVEQAGFRLGAVSNSTQSFSESVVMFKRGHAPEARQVGQQLGVSQTQLMTPEIEALAAGAPVAVVVGEDDAPASG